MKTSNISIEDFKYFNWKLQMEPHLKLIKDFKYFNWILQILQLNTSNCSIKDFKNFKNTSLPQNAISSTRIYLLKPCYLMTPSSWNFDNVVAASILYQDCFKITSRLLQDFFKSTLTVLQGFIYTATTSLNILIF